MLTSFCFRNSVLSDLAPKELGRAYSSVEAVLIGSSNFLSYFIFFQGESSFAISVQMKLITKLFICILRGTSLKSLGLATIKQIS